MSQSAVAEFMNSAATNPALLSRIVSAGEGRSASEAGAAIAALGAEAGFQFSGLDALAFRERALAINAASSDGEDGILEGVRGGSGDPYLDAQIEAMNISLGLVGPKGTGVGLQLAAGGAQGDLGGAATQAAQDMNESRNAVQQFFSSVFSGW